jgi:hypothetical protein
MEEAKAEAARVFLRRRWDRDNNSPTPIGGWCALREGTPDNAPMNVGREPISSAIGPGWRGRNFSSWCGGRRPILACIA